MAKLDKKAKNRISILRERIQKMQKQLSGAKEQNDEPEEVTRLENEIAAAHAEIEKLKQG